MQQSNPTISLRSDSMQTIAVLSAKGGVGKTSITANTGVALAQAGLPVLLLDLDPQNALCHHVGVDPRAAQGCALASLKGNNWNDTAVDCLTGMRLLPFGLPSDNERIAFERLLSERSDWLTRSLTNMALDPDTIVIFDTPPGPSIYVQRVLETTVLALVVTLADIASYAAMPSMERLLDAYSRHRPEFRGAKYIINQVDSGQMLARDIAETIKQAFGAAVIGRIHTDQFMREALANRQDVLTFAPYSQASHDIAACADRIRQALAVLQTSGP